jgi:multidrug efflux pump subunit AcrA (membrane-fusion protein)
MKKLLTFVPLLLLLSSCFILLPQEEPLLPPSIMAVPDPVTFRTVTVSQGDVTLFRDIITSNVAAQEESLSFPIGNLQIKNVYPFVGDIVQAGDIVAELDREDIEAAMDQARRSEEWLRLRLRQLNENHELALRRAAVTGNPVDAAAFIDQRNRLNNQLEMIRIDMEYLREQDDRRVLRAGIDGIVTHVIRFREGDTARADQRVLTISDQTRSIFMARGAEAQQLVIGERYEMVINREPYWVVVADPAELGVLRADANEMYMIVEDDTAFASNASGVLHFVMDKRDDTLFIPATAVRKVGDRVFVYVLEDGMRTLREITLGLEGNIRSEILHGLSLGEVIILD